MHNVHKAGYQVAGLFFPVDADVHERYPHAAPKYAFDLQQLCASA
jgi:hypothetical protein